MTAAMIGHNSSFEVANTGGAPSFFEFEEVKTISPPNEEQEQQDATHMKSPGRRREFVGGLINPGNMTVTINFVPGGDTDQFILAWREDGSTRDFRVTAPNAVCWNGQAFPTSYETPLENEGVLVATLTLQVTGEVTRDTAS